MKAREFITEYEGRRPKLSLRHLNQMKHEGRQRAVSMDRKLALVRRMYRNTDLERERMEFERLRIELDQLRAEPKMRKAEDQAETLETITDMARSGAKADREDRAKISDMARAEMRRRKK